MTPWRALEARIRDVEAQNTTPEDLYTSGCRFPKFVEEQELDSHWSEKTDPDPH